MTKGLCLVYVIQNMYSITFTGHPRPQNSSSYIHSALYIHTNNKVTLSVKGNTLIQQPSLNLGITTPFRSKHRDLHCYLHCSFKMQFWGSNKNNFIGGVTTTWWNCIKGPQENWTKHRPDPPYEFYLVGEVWGCLHYWGSESGWGIRKLKNYCFNTSHIFKSLGSLLLCPKAAIKQY